MSLQLNAQQIRLLCGRFAYEDGEALYHARKVMLRQDRHAVPAYAADIEEDSVTEQVSVVLAPGGKVEARCSCPIFHPQDHYCKHIAAALLNIQALQLGADLPDSAIAGSPKPLTADDLTSKLLQLFEEKRLRPTSARPLFDSRTILDVQFICRPFLYAAGKHWFGLEIKAGATKRYKVKNIQDFLARVDARASYTFSRHFTYDSEQHSFQPEDDAVLQWLIQMVRGERHQDFGGLLPIAPAVWEELLALLARAPSVLLVQGSSTAEGVGLSEDSPPLVFAFDQAEPGYQLDVQGLEDMLIMESYGMLLAKARLWKLEPAQLQRLSQLQQLLENSRSRQIRILQEQAEPFMEKVIPGLMKLGKVQIAAAVSARMLQTPLKAKLFLDRVKDRLLAGLEFQYGEIVLDPLTETGRERGAGQILLRDGEKERRILELLQQAAFIQTEGGYYLAGEEAEYSFLYHVLPELEKLATVFATSAVKERLFTEAMYPKVKLELREGTDWLEFQFQIDGISEREIRQLIQSLEEKRKYHRLPSGALMPLESAAYRAMIRLVNNMGIRKGDVKEGRIRLPLARALHSIDSPQQEEGIILGKSLRKLLENMRNPDHLEFPVPRALEPILRDYQKYGFQWLKTLAHYRFGGILADEMGLGKTLQSIAFLVSVLPEIRAQGLPAIIVAPTSLLYNWYNELKRFAPELKASLADGSRAARGDQLSELTGTDVLITSYPLLRRDFDYYSKLSFHTMILDEAQAFKNPATQTANAVKAIQARYRFALTGTPVENRLEELWSIFAVVFPGLLPGRKAFSELSRQAVARRIRPFLLRRLKADVLQELPEKIETLQLSELLPEQKKLYVAYLAELRQETLKHLSDGGFRRNRIKILAGITRLRQLCCHPALFVQGYTGSAAKFEQLLDMVQEYRSAGRRLLIFSQFTSMLGLIGRRLAEQEVPYFYLDGQTAAEERVQLCSRFNQGQRDVFLLSLKAGGTGLNLTGADTIILYDLWWNPAVEQQAADRAHRIGQRKVVQVIRLVAQGTLEEKIVELQQKKQNLIDEVVGPNQEALSSLSEDEIRELLSIN